MHRLGEGSVWQVHALHSSKRSWSETEQSVWKGLLKPQVNELGGDWLKAAHASLSKNMTSVTASVLVPLFSSNLSVVI